MNFRNYKTILVSIAHAHSDYVTMSLFPHYKCGSWSFSVSLQPLSFVWHVNERKSLAQVVWATGSASAWKLFIVFPTLRDKIKIPRAKQDLIISDLCTSADGRLINNVLSSLYVVREKNAHRNVIFQNYVRWICSTNSILVQYRLLLHKNFVHKAQILCEINNLQIKRFLLSLQFQRN